jgi:hypothetical protein
MGPVADRPLKLYKQNLGMNDGRIKGGRKVDLTDQINSKFFYIPQINEKANFKNV